MAESKQAAAARGASLLVLLQIGTRILTFAINQILLRFLSPELLGVSAQLDLLCITTIYFSRDSLRVAQQRQVNDPQAVVNIGSIPVLLGIPITFALRSLYIRNGLPEVPNIEKALQLYVTATIIELSAEPSFAVLVQKAAYGARARAESMATLGRCAALLGTVWYSRYRGFDAGALCFAAGQLAASSMFMIVLYVHARPVARTEGFSTKLTKIKTKSSDFLFDYFSRPVLNIWLNLYVQSAVKYVLTQGDSFLIARIATLQDQGIYALAANYGGLIARMLFQPIEESSRGLFAKSCAPTGKNRKPSAEGLQQTSNSLTAVLRFYGIVSLAAVSIGPTIAPLLLQIIAGQRWIKSGAGEVLATYCYYIPFLAFNGVSEAFVAAVASPQDLRFQSILMVLYSIIFAGTAYLGIQVLQLGAKGLILANCVNMFSRIVWHFSFVNTFFSRNGRPFDMSAATPSLLSFSVALAAATALPNATKIALPLLPSGPLGQLIKEGGIAALAGGLIVIGERRFILDYYRTMRPSTTRTKKTN